MYRVEYEYVLDKSGARIHNSSPYYFIIYDKEEVYFQWQTLRTYWLIALRES